MVGSFPVCLRAVCFLAVLIIWSLFVSFAGVAVSRVSPQLVVEILEDFVVVCDLLVLCLFLSPNTVWTKVGLLSMLHAKCLCSN